MRPLYHTLLASAAGDDSLLTLTGHVFPISSLAFGTRPDGNPLLAAGGGGTVRLWDPVSGGSVGKPLTASLTTVRSIVFSSDLDGRLMLAAGSGNGTVALWDQIPNESKGKEFAAYHNAVNSVAFGFGPGRRLLLGAGTANGRVQIWDLAVGELITSYDSSATGVVLGRDVDGRLLAAGQGRAEIWDPLTREPLYDLPADTGESRPLSFHPGPDQRLLLLSGTRYGLTVLVSDVKSGATVATAFTLFGSDLRDMSAVLFIGQDQRLMVAAAGGGGTAPRSVVLCDTLSGRREVLSGHTQPVNIVAIGPGPDGQLLLASGSDDHTVRVWDPAMSVGGESRADRPDWVQPTGSGSPLDGRLLEAAGSDGQMIRAWERNPESDRDDDMIFSKWGFDNTVAFAATADGRLMAAGSDYQKAWVWDPVTGMTIAGPLTGDGNWGRAVAFSTFRGERLLLAVGGISGTVHVHDVLSGKQLSVLTAINSGMVSSLAFGIGSDDQLLLAVGYSDPDLMDALPAPIQVWDPLTGEHVGGQLRGHTQHVLSVAFGTDHHGRLVLASGSTDCTVRLWDPFAAEAIGGPLTGHTGWVGPVTFSAHPETSHLLLISGGGDHAIRLWDLISRECRLELRRRSPVRSISATGRTLGITDHEGVSIIELDDQFDW